MAEEPERDIGDAYPIEDFDMNTEEEDISQLSICYVHTVAFQDVGLVWSNQKRRVANSSAVAATAPATDQEPEELELAALRELGLPSSFGVISQSTHHHRAQGAAWSDQPTPLTPKQTSTQQWQQAIDPATGYYYYYSEELQQTQWEIPLEGYIPAPEPSTAWWLPPEKTLQEHHVASHMEDMGAAEAEISPYAAAVDLYKQQHGWPRGNSDELKEEEIEKQKPRVETTGMLPHIVPPDPSQHTKFGSSSSSDDEELHEEEEKTRAPTALNEEDDEEQNNNKKPARTRRRKQRNRKVHDQYGELVLPPRLHKYWLQRYSFFSKYDHGISIDEEGWYSVTPEVIAWHHAKRMVASMGSKRCLAVDAFGGMGGNAIQLALAGCHVIAVEMDPSKATLLRQNSEVYGVDHLVEVICGDFLQVAPRIRADVVILSPPWGGPEYSQKEKFDVENMGGNPELGLNKLLELSFEVMGCSSALVWLPRSSSLVQIEKAAAVVGAAGGDEESSRCCEAEIATLNGVTKAMTVYFGAAAKRLRGQKQ